MTTLDWNALAGKFAQQMWLDSLRTLTLHRKVIRLNTFVTSKLKYVSSVLRPLGVHTAKITSTPFCGKEFPPVSRWCSWLAARSMED